MQKIKVLNLYAGIGGNRKLWDNVEVTAVELNDSISKIYSSFFPQDKVIVGDAHQYLLEHYKEFDFIWSSPPCPTHSRARFWGFGGNGKIPVFPDMTLYEEIIFLQYHFKNKYIIENVIPYYEPLVNPTLILHRHTIWSNFKISAMEFETLETCRKHGEREFLAEKLGFNLDNFSGIDKRKVLRNCVIPEIGLHIFNSAFNKKEASQDLLFKIAV